MGKENILQFSYIDYKAYIYKSTKGANAEIEILKKYIFVERNNGNGLKRKGIE